VLHAMFYQQEWTGCWLLSALCSFRKSLLLQKLYFWFIDTVFIRSLSVSGQYWHRDSWRTVIRQTWDIFHLDNTGITSGITRTPVET